MSALENEVKDAILRLSDADLARLVEVDFREHTEEAVAFAREEMARRGLSKKEKATVTVAPDRDSVASAGQSDGGLVVGPAAPQDEGQEIPELTPRAISKAAAFWGAVWLVLAAAVICFTVFITILGSQDEWRSTPFMVLVFAVCAAVIGVLLWAGIKRRPRWESTIAKAFVALAVTTFAFFLPPSGLAEDPGDRRDFLITAVAMAILALVFFVLGMIKRRRDMRQGDEQT